MPDELERHIQQSCAEQGIELTPNEITEGLAEAHQRIRPGPDGCCVRCGHDGSDGRDFRYGLCEICAFCGEPDCLGSPGETGHCRDHGGDGEPFKPLVRAKELKAEEQVDARHHD